MSDSIFLMFLVCVKDSVKLLFLASMVKLSLRSLFSINNLLIKVRNVESSSVLKLCAKLLTILMLTLENIITKSIEQAKLLFNSMI